MAKDEQTTKGKLSTIYTLGKWVGIFLLFIIGLFLLAHFALRYGIHIEALSRSLKEHWVFWLSIRLAIYCLIGICFYMAYYRAKPEMAKIYQRVIRAVIICIVAVEFINIIQ